MLLRPAADNWICSEECGGAVAAGGAAGDATDKYYSSCVLSKGGRGGAVVHRVTSSSYDVFLLS